MSISKIRFKGYDNSLLKENNRDITLVFSGGLQNQVIWFIMKEIFLLSVLEKLNQSKELFY